MFAKTAAPPGSPRTAGRSPAQAWAAVAKGRGFPGTAKGSAGCPEPVAVPQHPAPSTQARCPAPQPAGGGRHHPAPPPLRLPLSPAHPGACPRFPAGPRRVRCPNACSDDRGCPPEQKCCFTGCGLGCVTPLGSGSSDFAPPGEVDWSLSQAEETHRGDKGGVLGVPGPLCTMGGSEPF